jgi:hypothetical protein
MQKILRENLDWVQVVIPSTKNMLPDPNIFTWVKQKQHEDWSSAIEYEF